MNIKVNYPESKEDIEELKQRGSRAIADFLLRNFSKEDISKALEIVNSADNK